MNGGEGDGLRHSKSPWVLNVEETGPFSWPSGGRTAAGRDEPKPAELDDTKHLEVRFLLKTPN